MLAAVQPVRFHVMAAGSKRTFTTTWVGLVDVASGKSAVVGSTTRELLGTSAEAWGKAAKAAAELDAESSLAISQAWRTLQKSW